METISNLRKANLKNSEIQTKVTYNDGELALIQHIYDINTILPCQLEVFVIVLVLEGKASISINGNRCISNNVHPINTLADLQGIKLRVPTVSHYVKNFQAMGASVVTMAMTEIFTALQQGTIEGQENPPSTLLANGWYEVQDYLAMTNHQIAMNFVLINDKFYNSMSAEDQAALDEACYAFVDKQLELFLVAMEEDVKTLEEYGLEVSYPDREEFKEAGSVVIDEYRSEYPEFDAVMEKIEALQAQ